MTGWGWALLAWLTPLGVYGFVSLWEDVREATGWDVFANPDCVCGHPQSGHEWDGRTTGACGAPMREGTCSCRWFWPVSPHPRSDAW